MWNKKEKLPFKIIINPSYEWVEDAKLMGVSHRELEVFALQMDGHNNKEIAQILGIQHQSVKNHVFSLYKKLNAKNMGQAMFILLFNNFIKTEVSVFNKTEQETGQQWIEETKILLSDENHSLDDKTKKFIKKFFVEHGLYGRIYKARAEELKDKNDELPK